MLQRRRREAKERYAAFIAATRQTVLDAAGDVVEAGAARIEHGQDEGGDFIALIPANPHACEVTVYLDGWPTVALGEEGHTTELVGLEEMRLEELRQLIRAVIAGNYEWEYRQVRKRLFGFASGQHTQLVGSFHTEDGRGRFTRQGSLPAGMRERVTYEPYVA